MMQRLHRRWRTHCGHHLNVWSIFTFVDLCSMEEPFCSAANLWDYRGSPTPWKDLWISNTLFQNKPPLAMSNSFVSGSAKGDILEITLLWLNYSSDQLGLIEWGSGGVRCNRGASPHFMHTLTAQFQTVWTEAKFIYCTSKSAPIPRGGCTWTHI